MKPPRDERRRPSRPAGGGGTAGGAWCRLELRSGRRAGTHPSDAAVAAARSRRRCLPAAWGVRTGWHARLWRDDAPRVVPRTEGAVCHAPPPRRRCVLDCCSRGGASRFLGRAARRDISSFFSPSPVRRLAFPPAPLGTLAAGGFAALARPAPRVSCLRLRWFGRAAARAPARWAARGARAPSARPRARRVRNAERSRRRVPLGLGLPL